MRLLVLLLGILAVPVQADCVILLHGLARSAGSMELLAEKLEAQGYQAVNTGYPSTSYPIETLASMAVESGLARCGDAEQVHFVTHSMGGILLRQYLSTDSILNLGRVVMLGPPNQGSEVVDKLGDFPGFEMINGEAGLQLGTGPDSIPNQLGPATFDLGIIAGTSSINLILSSLIPGDDDGKVSVERAKLQGMSDFITVPASHPLLMRDREVIRQVLFFLEHGRFHHGGVDLL